MRDSSQEDPRCARMPVQQLTVFCIWLPDPSWMHMRMEVQSTADGVMPSRKLCAARCWVYLPQGSGGGEVRSELHRAGRGDRVHGQRRRPGDGDHGHHQTARRHARQLPGRRWQRQRGAGHHLLTHATDQEPVIAMTWAHRSIRPLVGCAPHLVHARSAHGCSRWIRSATGAVCGFVNSLVPAQVVAAFKILTSDPQVKAILVNIFGASIVMRIGCSASVAKSATR